MSATNADATVLLDVTETDSYIPGNEFYRTDVTLQNPGSNSVPAVLYRAGDCYLGNSDYGFGIADSGTGRVACVNAVDPSATPPVPGERVIEWIPLSAGSSYLHDSYYTVWSAIGTQAPFGNDCNFCDVFQDNGAGLSWVVDVPAGGSVTVSHLTVFSPTGASNQAPNAVGDALEVDPGTGTGSVDVLANDSDPDEDAISIDSWTDGSDGSVSCDGSVCTYAAGEGFSGTDSFTYTIIDTLGNTATATVNVTQASAPENQPPTANDDHIVIDESGTGSVDVLANDSDPDEDAISIDSWTDGSDGSVSCDGSVCTYAAGEGFSGTDSFTYTITDPSGASATATVTVDSTPAPADCPAVASALDAPDLIVGESWLVCSSPTANGIVGPLTPILDPVGETSVLLTSGDVALAPGPNDSTGATRANGTTFRGANDVSTLQVDLDVPDGANCLSFDFVFGSEEYPEYVGSAYNDAFIAELDSSTWMVNSSEIDAPRNFATDAQGRLVSINSGFFAVGSVVPDSGSSTTAPRPG